MKNNQIKFNHALKKQREFPNKLNDTKIARKNFEQKNVINNLEEFYKSREELFNFFRYYTKIVLDSS